MHENDFFNEDLLCALAGVAGEDNVLMSEPMREHTTFKIGGPADVFVTPDTEQGLVATLDTCYRCDLPLTIVGNGSDLLVGDKGIRGVVVALGEGLSNITVDGTHVTAAAVVLQPARCFPMSPRRQPRPASPAWSPSRASPDRSAAPAT